MSVLHSRIIRHGGQAANQPARHPYGTGQTQMVTPAFHVTYDWTGTGYYQTLYPSQPATGDPNAVPVAVFAPAGPGSGPVLPAGRP